VRQLRDRRPGGMATDFGDDYLVDVRRQLFWHDFPVWRDLLQRIVTYNYLLARNKLRANKRPEINSAARLR
jgi:hypothetical protein